MVVEQKSGHYDQCKLAYAAGYFDGEGTINVLTCKGRFQIRVELTSYDLDSLMVFVELFGGALRSNEYTAVKFQVYRWAMNNMQAISVLSAMVPFLRAKKRQAELVLDSGWNLQRPGLTEFQIEMRAALYHALKEAKKENKREKPPRSSRPF